ncbi:hypothetical protein D1007_24694 [Hordeum vulgare]|nr:hypothetical protein D1007_24694 [Hordeum vulgare]
MGPLACWSGSDASRGSCDGAMLLRAPFMLLDVGRDAVLAEGNGASYSPAVHAWISPPKSNGLAVCRRCLTVAHTMVREIEKLLETLAKLLKDLQNSNEESKVVTKTSAMKDIKRRMEKDVNEVTKVARLTKSKLHQLNKEVRMKA